MSFTRMVMRRLTSLVTMKAAYHPSQPLLFSRRFQTASQSLNKKTFSLTFAFPDGSKRTVPAEEGDRLCDVKVKNGVEIEGFGTCKGTMGCSTCHLIFATDDFSKLTIGVTDTSGMGCQVFVTKDIDGITVKVPDGIKYQS